MSRHPHEELRKILTGLRPQPDRIFLLTDSNVEPLATPYVEICRGIAPVFPLKIAAGEESKSIATACRLAGELVEKGATRSSLMVNVGGGVVTDLGGFTASIFKRGIRTVNVASTLLGAVDAAIGGKPGVAFSGYKNELGTFHMPAGVVVATDLLPSQPADVMCDGYAELLKTTMLLSDDLYRKALNMEEVMADAATLGSLAETCARFKEDITLKDPEEKGLRRILNLGHTFGHAFESLLMERHRPVGHGTAVAHGLLCSLIMSHLALGLDSSEISAYRMLLLENYRRLGLGCPDRDEIIRMISHDKKCGADGRPRFVLLEKIGKPIEEYAATDEEIRTTLELYNSMTE